MSFVLCNLLEFGNPVAVGIIAAVVIVLFGGSKLAGLGKSLGDGMREFRKATKEGADGDPPAVPEEPISVSAPVAQAGEPVPATVPPAPVTAQQAVIEKPKEK